MTVGYTVGQLRKALSDLPQDLYVYDDCGEMIVGIDLIGNETAAMMPKNYALLVNTYREDCLEAWEPDSDKNGDIRRGMIEYESICEKIIDGINYDENAKMLFRCILDNAQRIFDKKR